MWLLQFSTTDSSPPPRQVSGATVWSGREQSGVPRGRVCLYRTDGSSQRGTALNHTARQIASHSFVSAGIIWCLWVCGSDVFGFSVCVCVCMCARACGGSE